jgi:hypothetical protein
MNNAARMIINNLPNLQSNIQQLVTREVLVGVPADKAGRRESNSPNNAMLAYVHDNGSPAQNIPARPFMTPGIERVKEDIKRELKEGARACLDGSISSGAVHLNRVGIIAQSSIRNRINEGIAPPLSDATLQARIKNRTSIQGAKKELKRREQGLMPSATAEAKPLIATGQLRNSINYVIREK